MHCARVSSQQFTWSTIHKETSNAQRHAWKTSLGDNTYFPSYQSQCGVESVECGVWRGKCRVWTADCQIRSVQCQAVLTTSQKYLHKLLPRNTLYCNAGTKHVPVLLCTTKLARSTFQYDRVLQSLHKALPCRYFLLQSLPKALPSTTVYYKACTKNFPVLPCTTNPVLLCTTRLTKHVPILLCTTKLAGSHSRYYLLQSLQEVVPSTMYYKACRKSFPVLVCTTELTQSTFQYDFVLQSLQELLPSTTVYYKLAQSTSQYYFVLQSLHKTQPSTTLYYKACTKHVPVLLWTIKLAQSTCQYDFVLQSLHKARSSTTLYYKTCTKHHPVRLCATTLACTKHFPVLPCTTKLAQSYFPVRPCTTNPVLLCTTKLAQSHVPSTTLCYKACRKSFPVLLCTTKLAESTFHYDFVLQSSHKALPSTTLYYKACTKHVPVLLWTIKLAQSTCQYDFVLQSLHKARSSTTLYYKTCKKHHPVRLCATTLACTKHFPVLPCTTKLAQSTSQYDFVLQSLHKARSSTTLYLKTCTQRTMPQENQRLETSTWAQQNEHVVRDLLQFWHFRHVLKQVGMLQTATPATQNDMTTCLETFEKDRFCSFPHRHGIKRARTTRRCPAAIPFTLLPEKPFAAATPRSAQPLQQVVAQRWQPLQQVVAPFAQPLQQVGAKSASPWRVKIHNNQTSSVWHEHIIQHVPISLIHWNIYGYGPWYSQFRTKTSLWNSKTCTEERRWHNPYACQHWGSESQKAVQQTKVTTGAHGKKHELQFVFISGKCFINTSECLSRASGPERGQHRVAQRTRGNTSRESKEWLWMPNNAIRSIPDQQCQLLTTSVHDDADDEDDYDYIMIMMMMMIMVMMLTTTSTMTVLMSMMMVMMMMKKMRMIMSTMTVLMSMMMVMMMKKKKMLMITSTMTALMRMMMVMMMMMLMMMNIMNEGASRAQASPAIMCTSEPKSRAQARRLPFWVGKSTISTGLCSIAMLQITEGIGMYRLSTVQNWWFIGFRNHPQYLILDFSAALVWFYLLIL